MTLLEIEALSVRLGGRSLLRAVSLQLEPGELLGLIGPNGAGKSTLLKAVVQLLPHSARRGSGRGRPDHGWSGRIRLLGDDANRLAPRERARRLAYLSQDDRVQWPIRVEDLVALGRHPYQSSWRSSSSHAGGRTGSWAASQSSSDDRRAIEAALRTTDIVHLRARRATEISGGERARARLARALAVEAPLLLADEPVAALDPLHQLKVMNYLRAYCQDASYDRALHGHTVTAQTAPPGRAAIVVMHDLTLASRFCDRLLLLHRGEPIALGAPDEVLSSERLHNIYGIRAIRGHIDGHSYVLPWALSEEQANHPKNTVRNASDRRLE